MNELKFDNPFGAPYNTLSGTMTSQVKDPLWGIPSDAKVYKGKDKIKLPDGYSIKTGDVIEFNGYRWEFKGDTIDLGDGMVVRRDGLVLRNGVQVTIPIPEGSKPEDRHRITLK